MAKQHLHVLGRAHRCTGMASGGPLTAHREDATFVILQRRIWQLARGHRRRQWHPTPVLLPGKSHGRRSLVGCSPRGR